MNQEFINYIKENLAKGVAEDQIRQSLLASGWLQTDIDAAFLQLEAPPSSLPPFPIKPPSAQYPARKNEDKPLKAQLVPADYVKRVLAGLIDLTLIFIVVAILRIPLSIISSVLFKHSDFDLVYLTYYAPLIIVFAAYFVFLTAVTGQTLGKRIFGLKVTSVNGNKINWIQAFVRETFGKFISFIFFNLGFIWIFIDGKGRGWHDKFARTQVIDTKGTITQEVTLFGVFISLILGFIVWAISSPSSVALTILSLFSILPPVSLLVSSMINFLPRIILQPHLVQFILGLIPIDLLPDIKVWGGIFTLVQVLPYLAALYPVALYLSRRTRSLIVVLLIVHMMVTLILTSAVALSEAHTNKEIEKEREQQIAFTTEKLTSITKGYLLTNPPENWSDPSISWSLRGNTEYVSVGYLYKIEDYIEKKIDRTSEGRILLTEFKSPETSLQCDIQTFQEIELLNSSVNPKNGICEEIIVHGKKAIIIKNKWITYQNIQNVETTIIVFGKDETRIHLLYEDYSKGEKSLPSDQLTNLASNLKPMTEEDIKKFGAIEDYLKLLEQRRR